MNKEEMTATILAYSVELRDEYNEMVKEFGYKDLAAQRLQTKYTTVLLLIEKLGLDENYWNHTGHLCLCNTLGRDVLCLLFII